MRSQQFLGVQRLKVAQEKRDRFFKVVVDHAVADQSGRVVGLQAPPHFLRRITDSGLERFGRLGASFLKPLLQGVNRWWKDKESVRFGESIDEFLGALNIDVQQWDLLRRLDGHDL